MATAALLIASPSESGRALVDQADFFRFDAGRFLDGKRRGDLGQFLTPAPVARFMAALSQPATTEIRLLDPGAGVGSITAAWVEEILSREKLPRSVHLTACEIDPQLVKYLRQTIAACRTACRAKGVNSTLRL